jgi:hypothetical protein
MVRDTRFTTERRKAPQKRDLRFAAKRRDREKIHAKAQRRKGAKGEIGKDRFYPVMLALPDLMIQGWVSSPTTAIISNIEVIYRNKISLRLIFRLGVVTDYAEQGA